MPINLFDIQKQRVAQLNREARAREARARKSVKTSAPPRPSGPLAGLPPTADRFSFPTGPRTPSFTIPDAIRAGIGTRTTTGGSFADLAAERRFGLEPEKWLQGPGGAAPLGVAELWEGRQEPTVDTIYQDSGGDGGGDDGGGGGPAVPAEPQIPEFEGLPLGLIPPAWYKLNPNWASVPAEARQFVATLNRLLPLYGTEDIPFLAGLISSVGGAEFARYGESSVQSQFVLPEEAGGGIPDLNARLVAASGLMGPLSPAARNLGQALFPAALASLPTRTSRIAGHKDISELVRAQQDNPFAALLQRMVEPSQFRPPPGSMVFTREGPRVVRNPSLFV